MEYSIYETATGKIIKHLSLSGEISAANHSAGESFILGYVDFESKRVVGGAVVDIPPKPDNNSEFNFTTSVWEDNRPISAIRATKNKEINESRLKANRSSFTYQAKQIACDELSRSDIDGVNGEVAITSALPANFPGGWKCMDNTYVSIPDVSAWTDFYLAMVAQGQANFLHAQNLKTQLAAATTKEQIEAIMW